MHSITTDLGIVQNTVKWLSHQQNAKIPRGKEALALAMCGMDTLAMIQLVQSTTIVQK